MSMSSEGLQKMSYDGGKSGRFVVDSPSCRSCAVDPKGVRWEVTTRNVSSGVAHYNSDWFTQALLIEAPGSWDHSHMLPMATH